MLSYVRELFHYRELLWSWVVRNIRVRYKQSLLGVVWAILQPLSTTVIMAVVFSRFIRVPTDGIPHPIFTAFLHFWGHPYLLGVSLFK